MSTQPVAARHVHDLQHGTRSLTAAGWQTAGAGLVAHGMAPCGKRRLRRQRQRTIITITSSSTSNTTTTAAVFCTQAITTQHPLRECQEFVTSPARSSHYGTFDRLAADCQCLRVLWHICSGTSFAWRQHAPPSLAPTCTTAVVFAHANNYNKTYDIVPTTRLGRGHGASCGRPA